MSHSRFRLFLESLLSPLLTSRRLLSLARIEASRSAGQRRKTLNKHIDQFLAGQVKAAELFTACKEAEYRRIGSPDYVRGDLALLSRIEKISEKEIDSRLGILPANARSLTDRRLQQATAYWHDYYVSLERGVRWRQAAALLSFVPLLIAIAIVFPHVEWPWRPGGWLGFYDYILLSPQFTVPLVALLAASVQQAFSLGDVRRLPELHLVHIYWTALRNLGIGSVAGLTSYFFMSQGATFQAGDYPRIYGVTFLLTLLPSSAERIGDWALRNLGK